MYRKQILLKFLYSVQAVYSQPTALWSPSFLWANSYFCYSLLFCYSILCCSPLNDVNMHMKEKGIHEYCQTFIRHSEGQLLHCKVFIFHLVQ
jgi:hypothetical protein